MNLAPSLSRRRARGDKEIFFMQIVVLDGYTLNPGDLSWAALEALGPLTVYDRSSPEETATRAAAAEIVLTNKTVLSREILLRLPQLRYIGVLATGYNIVDIAAARERNVPVSNVPDYGASSVVQMAFAHLLNLVQHAADHARSVAAGGWSRCPDFCYWEFPLHELAGLTMGIVGFGRIGRGAATVARAFGMNVLVHDVSPREPAEGVRFVGLDELFRESDVVSLHCPLTPATEKLVNHKRLAMMKRSAFLINTARGPLVDEAALAEALGAGRLAGAGLDVLSVEPPPIDNPLLSAKNCYVTPHIAWATRAARQRLLDMAVANVRAFLDGRPQNVVNR
jgi:glycerate dehydrogenase